ncbi:ATP-binding protein [Chromatiaceae bacterium AAb-1]|nr:ATP-binding protein [Chromatiaceae bacterium AAb-1]
MKQFYIAASVKITLFLTCMAIALILLQRLLLPEHNRAALIIIPVFLLLIAGCHYLLKPLYREMQALKLHAQNLQDGSFNISANQQSIAELRPMYDALQAMSVKLRHERATLYQRELLLDTIIRNNPAALLLTDDKHTILMSNPAAQLLLKQSGRITGYKLTDIAATIPALQQALARQQQGLLHLQDTQQSIWHLSVTRFELNQRLHWLYQLKPMTAEIQREEIQSWKKLLRVIGHELNNTLAPLSSLAYSGQQLAQQSPALQQIFSTISERCQHLNQFLQAYIAFAKIPHPVPQPINWPRLINQLQDQYDFECHSALPQQHWQADPVLLQQLLLNLLKNAHENGSAPDSITLGFQEQPRQLIITLQDTAGGMSEEVLSHALLPFYTTKPKGSGIGLTLCRDIIEAHGGSIELRNYDGGLQVKLTLPAPT